MTYAIKKLRLPEPPVLVLAELKRALEDAPSQFESKKLVRSEQSSLRGDLT